MDVLCEDLCILLRITDNNNDDYCIINNAPPYLVNLNYLLRPENIIFTTTVLVKCGLNCLSRLTAEILHPRTFINSFF